MDTLRWARYWRRWCAADSTRETFALRPSALALAAVLLVVNLALPYLLHRQTLPANRRLHRHQPVLRLPALGHHLAASGTFLSRLLALRCSGGRQIRLRLYVFNSIVFQCFTSLGVAYWIHRYYPCAS